MRLLWKLLNWLGWKWSGLDWMESDGRDLRVPEGQMSQWVEIGPFAIDIIRTDEGVVVDIYAIGGEMEDAIASAYAFEVDAQAVLMDVEEDPGLVQPC